MDCLFCGIANSDIPSVNLYEDDATFAFLDINPLAPGHALVVPKAHATHLQELSDADAAALMTTTKKLAPVLASIQGATDCTIALNDGPAAGQEIPHVHIHIVPRKEGDSGGPIHALFTNRPSMSTDDLHDLAMQVQSRV